jgi:light-regulated signal transduction histidine kinase (bacteriophytochrome)
MIAIQPCALLLVVGPDWQVETASANVAMLGDGRPTAVVGEPLADLIGSKAIHTLRNRMSWLSSDESEVQDFGVEWGDVTLDVRAVRASGHYLIEAELAVEPRLPDGIGMVRSMSDRLSGDNPLRLAEQAMRQLSALTGFDQLMLVDRNGTVVASAERGKRASAGLPADKTVRITADRDAEPVPLLGSQVPDLVNRAAYVAPDDEQRERLAAIGVASTIALPLRIDGQLVGAVHALHHSPRRCGAERRSVAHLFAERLVARMARCGWQPSDRA